MLPISIAPCTGVDPHECLASFRLSGALVDDGKVHRIGRGCDFLEPRGEGGFVDRRLLEQIAEAAFGAGCLGRSEEVGAVARRVRGSRRA